MFGRDLGDHVDALVAAVETRDDQRFFEALQGITRTTPQTRPDKVQAALGKLVPVLAQIPYGMGADLAQVAGSMAEYGTDPTIVLPTLVNRAAEAMEQAERFEELYRTAFGDVPDAEDAEQIQPTLERFVGGAADLGLTEWDASMLAQAWFCGGQWVQPVLYLSQRKDVRAILPERARLTAAIDTMRESIGTAHWLHGLLLVLDDEPLIVLDRATGRGFRVEISGIGDNFQLHTLLAAALIGDESQGMLPGRRPSAEEIAAASDGEELAPSGGIRGNFNLVSAGGEWIWNEGRPADIPKLDGVRVVVLDPSPYERTWNAGRAYPLMRPTLTVQGPLPADQAAHWLALVKPAATTHHP
ncbi:hypothetical protein BDK92_5046 [Micromonospora pisi]|uniref:Uncharacterized protein n=1 Tax=Micromonospora pisi TaxID=589240 RepID=A0A495JNU3_9ACTN|nr:hypothetical protein [Micromonospora pisi]RKR90667.1 hypothetical protein BDK92_5046 [Micromonospora pisi]